MSQRTPKRSYTNEEIRRAPASGRSSASRSAYDSGPRPERYSGQPRSPQQSRSGTYQERVSRQPSRSRRRRKKKGTGKLVALLIVLVLLACGVVFVLKSGILQPGDTVEEFFAEKPLPKAPQVVKTATVGTTGDIILHVPILEAHQTGEGEYDFTYVFSNVAEVYQQSDLMIANLEVTLGGPESGEYSGYPGFNSPDAIAAALKNAGVDLCLTANNHSNDTGYYGMMRTLEVLDEYGLEHLGSRETTDEHYLMTKNINGIRLGMLCYTYDTREYTEGEKSLNFNYLSDEGVQKIATFNYEYLDEFYADVQEQLDYMDMLNVDSRIIFMHWGTEYQDEPNELQRSIAQRLCDMGFDVIIGGHPHVIQEFETLTSGNGHEAICLYSMGNELSNQRADIMDEDGNRGYTEDGLVIQVIFEKFNNGRTKVGGVNIIPTWVELDYTGYQIIGLDGTDPWSWGAGNTDAAIASYNRTLGRIGGDYIAYRARKNQSAVVEYIE
ncbi:MAG: CapA family protein [Parasporobacterium sp.]|nr:CapA family protein [Parasporobacterium sp.]MBQ9031093.1 CapA family protein [Parasporobacterium sp.]